MSHPYPPHLKNFSYVGRYRYFLTFCCIKGTQPFKHKSAVDLVLRQILRAAGEKAFEIIAYCFMPDHLHLLVSGGNDTADCRAFIKAAKQYSGYYHRRELRHSLWQRYGYEHVIREDIEQGATIRYILDNPVRAGIVKTAAEYPFTGSNCHTMSELEQLATASDEAKIPR